MRSTTTDVEQIITEVLSPFGWMTPSERATFSDELRRQLSPADTLQRAVRTAQDLAGHWQKDEPLGKRARRLVAAALVRAVRTSSVPAERREAWRHVEAAVDAPAAADKPSRPRSIRQLLVALRYGSDNHELGAIAALLALPEEQARAMHDEGLDAFYEVIIGQRDDW